MYMKGATSTACKHSSAASSLSIPGTSLYKDSSHPVRSCIPGNWGIPPPPHRQEEGAPGILLLPLWLYPPNSWPAGALAGSILPSLL